MAKGIIEKKLIEDLVGSLRDKKIIDSTPSKLADITTKINNYSGGSTSHIGVAEFSGSVVSLIYNSQTIEQKTYNDTKVDYFTVEIGKTYTVSVTSDVGNWSKQITITEPGITYVKGRSIGGLSIDKLSETCTKKISKYMFELQDTRSFNNIKCYIQHFHDDGSIQFGSIDAVDGVDYAINKKCSHCTSLTDTAFTQFESNCGGFKYSGLRRSFMISDSEIYGLASGLKPVGSTITDGIPIDQFVYTDTGSPVGIYRYTYTTDTMTEVTDYSTLPTATNPFFWKGYFELKNNLQESEYIPGRFYTMSNSRYTLETGSYSSSKTYYGFYERTQTNGRFFDMIYNQELDGHLKRMDLRSSAGLNQCTKNSQYYDYITLPSLGELMGQYIQMSQKDGTTSLGPLYYGEIRDSACPPNAKFDGCTANTWYKSYNMWTRSVSTNLPTSFYYLHNLGNVNYIYASTGNRVRVSFCIQ